MEAFKQKGVDLEEVARRNFYELAFSHCRQGWGAEGRAGPSSHFLLVCRLLDKKDLF